MEQSLNNLKGKKILVVGLGRSGIAACKALVKQEAQVFVQDSKNAEAIDGELMSFLNENCVKGFYGEKPDDMSLFDMLVLSPGVSPELDFVCEAEKAGSEIIGELELAYRLGKGKYIGITGTNGKTTTTTLVGEIFKNDKRKTHVVGNIGVAVVSASVDADDDTWLVTETSSFQLETTKHFRPVVSAILNLTPDHLNRHHTMEAYGEAKAKIFAAQTEEDWVVLNFDDPGAWELQKHGCKAGIVPFSRKEELEFGAFVKDGKIVIADREKTVEICDLTDIRIIGGHNVENTLAAAAISYFAGIAPEVIGEAIRNFGGVEHRIEFSGEIGGVKYYNDSKGTNVDAAITAINALEKNIILIAGGDGKSQDFVPLVEAFGDRVKHMILLGRDAGIIARAADEKGFNRYSFAKDMDECVAKAAEMAVSGDNVLLSPACASWDMYPNFEIRGEHFKKCVSRL